MINPNSRGSQTGYLQKRNNSKKSLQIELKCYSSKSDDLDRHQIKKTLENIIDLGAQFMNKILVDVQGQI